MELDLLLQLLQYHLGILMLLLRLLARGCPHRLHPTPDINSTLKMMHSMVEHGVDLIELGIPFTDPIADGPVIQRGIERALKNKVSLSDILKKFDLFRRQIIPHSLLQVSEI